MWLLALLPNDFNVHLKSNSNLNSKSNPNSNFRDFLCIDNTNECSLCKTLSVPGDW